MPKHRVASVVELPEGKAMAVEVQGKRIALFHHRGEIFALDAVCPYREGLLHEGTIDDGIVACPWHQWRFDLRTGVSPVSPLSRVGAYAVSVEGDGLFVDLDSEANP